jgi:hypothetical protein
MKTTPLSAIGFAGLLGLILITFSLIGFAQQSHSDNGGSEQAIDLDGLIDRISNSKSLGFFTKLSLKGDIDKLLDGLGGYHDNTKDATLPELRERYDVLVHKLVVLLQDEDQELVKTIRDGRERIWSILTDKKKFATL